MDLHGGDADRLDRIQQRDAGMGIGTGIDHDAVGTVTVGLLDAVDQAALMVGLVELHLHTIAVAKRADLLAQGIIGTGAVQGRLTDAQHIQIRSVDHQYLH